MKPTRTLLAVAGLLGAAALTGCGGGGMTGAGQQIADDGSGRGAIEISVKWPAPSKLIPVTSQAIAVVVKSTSGSVLATPPVITKPVGTLTSTSSTIGNLPAGSVTVTATAYPNSDGSGNAQATGSLTATVQAGKTTTTPALTMGTTIKTIQLTPSASTATVGQQITVTASAR